MADSTAADGPSRIVVLGLAGGAPPPHIHALVDSADLVVGGSRHLALLGTDVPSVPLNGDLPAALDRIAAEPGQVCVLASGDPGFFGIVRALGERFGSERLDVRPAPSAVSLAFARLGLSWDDAVVVSAHGRPLPAAARTAAAAPKAAVLTSPDAPPEALGAALVGAGATHTRAVVCSRLGAGDEVVTEVDLAGLTAGTWDPLSVVVLLHGIGVATAPARAWGLPDTAFASRDGMLTKAEVRAVALSKLALPDSGVMWDVGAGSGSVAVECARLAPGVSVYAVDRDSDSADLVRMNARTHGVQVHVVEAAAPAALNGLPSPQRAFVGGGGLTALDATLARLDPGGRVVATFAALDRAAAAYSRLGHLVEIGVSRGAPLPGGSVRLAAENPVFVAWGPDE